MKNTAVLLVSALLVGVAGGYLVGKNTSFVSTGAEAGAEGPVNTRSRAEGRDGGSGASTESKTRGGSKGYEDIVRMPGSTNRLQAMIEFYQGLTIEQLEEEARKLEDLPMNERMMAGILLFGRWGEVDARSAMEYANTMGFASMFVRPTVLQSWASVDPVNAALYYDKHPREFMMMGGGGGRGGRGGFMSSMSGSSIIAGEWAKQDPDAAMKWASGLANGKGDAYSAVVSEVAKTDPAKAAKFLSNMDPAEASSSYRSVAEAYGSKNFADAKAWIQTLPANEQVSALASAISGLAKTDPQGAAQQAAAMTAGEPKDRAVEGVVSVMARSNPQAAAEYLMQQGGVDAQSESMRAVIPNWVNKDPAGAMGFVNSLPQGQVRDSGVRSYVWSNRSAPPSDLVQMAETISDEGDRNRTVGWMVGRWMNEDADAARAYVEKSTTISDRMKEHLLGEGQRGGGR